jgi:hypothetical protein
MLTAIPGIITPANKPNPADMLPSEYYVPFLFQIDLDRIYQ